jgi:glycerate-2-kinase
VGAANKVTELVEALEMTEQIRGDEMEVSCILTRWRREMESMGVPARTHLMIQLLKIKMEVLHDRYI